MKNPNAWLTVDCLATAVIGIVDVRVHVRQIFPMNGKLLRLDTVHIQMRHYYFSMDSAVE